MRFEASQLAEVVKRENFRAWFAHRIADKYSRNTSHGDLIARLATLAKSGILKQHHSECQEWERWVLVRNSVVHLGGRVSNDLATAWPAQYPTEGRPIKLTDKDILRAAYISRVLARALDKRLVQEVIGDNDQVLLAQELFIRTGVSNPKRLSAAVSKCMGSNMKTNKAEEAVAAQRRGKTLDHGFSFIEEMLPSI